MAAAKDLQPLLDVLTSTADGEAEKLQAYQTLISYFEENSNVVISLKEHIDALVVSACKHIKQTPELSQTAVQAVGLCLNQKDIVESLSGQNTKELLQCICETIKSTTDKATCTRCLWFLSKQRCDEHVMAEQLENIVQAIEHGQCEKNFQSMAVEYEGLSAILHLLQQLPQQMKPLTPRWGKLVYPLVVHSAGKLREKAKVAMETGMPAMLEHREELVKQLVPDLKALLISEMTKLMTSKHEMFVLNVWSCYVKILGKALHHGSLINYMLPLVEKGFKHPSADIKCAAYKCWQVLMDNFSLQQEIIGDNKRVKLLMQVFRINNAKYESVALAKMKAWWHLVHKLGDKASLYFEQVCVPLLQYCVSGTVGGQTPTIHRIGLASPPVAPSTPGSSAAMFPSVQALGAQVITLMLGLPATVIPGTTLDPLSHALIPSAAFFVKNSAVFISTTKQSILNLGDTMEGAILDQLWSGLMEHVKAALESANKKDAGETFRALLETLRDVITAQCLKPATALTLFRPLVELPPKVLLSSTYHVSSSVSGVMQGCPALFLLGVLLHHRILETCSTNKRLLHAFEGLMECGKSSMAVLEFYASAVVSLQEAAAHMDNKEALLPLWSLLAEPLHSHIVKSQEVNQGSTLDHDFSCLVSVLGFPVKYLLPRTLSQGSIKSLTKAWHDLYDAFARLAALVPNTEANMCCQEMCLALQDTVTQESASVTEDVTFLQPLLNMVQVVIDTVDFSGFSNSTLLNPLSPCKPRSTGLGNLHALVKLCGKLTTCLLAASDKTQKSVAASQNSALALCGVLESLYTHAPSTSTVTAMTEILATPIGEMLSASASKTNKMYSSQVLGKVEQLWSAIVTCLQSRYTGIYDSDMLATVAPLLIPAFSHSRRAIKNNALSLWNTTFAHGPRLKYPEPLKPVLMRVKEKSPIQLPGWETSEMSHIEDVGGAVSQLTQGESQISIPNISGLKSPVKAVGSFLSKAVSPNIKSSPLLSPTGKSPGKGAMTTTPGKAKKKLALNSFQDMKEKDFVVISSPARKKRVLTEHQKDVLRHNKRDKGLPVLYSTLDAASQDASMFSAEVTQDANSNTCTPDIQITPFPFAGIKKTLSAEHMDTAKDGTLSFKSKFNMEKEKENSDSSQAEDVIDNALERKAKRNSRRKSVRFSSSSDETAVDGKPAEKSDRKDTGDKVADKVIKTADEKTVSDSEVIVVGETQSEAKIDDSVILISDTQKTDSSGCNSAEVGRQEEGDETQDTTDGKRTVEESIMEIQDTEKEKDEVTSSDPQKDVEIPSTPKRTRQMKISDILSPDMSEKGNKMDLGDTEDAQETPKKRSTRTRSQEGSQSTGKTRSKVTPLKRKSRSVDSPSKVAKGKRDESPFASTLDKWMNKASGGKEIEEVLPDSNKSKGSVLFGDNDEDDVVKAPTPHGVVEIMAEDTQQFSPSKFKKLSEASCDVSVLETPLKEDTSVLSAEQAEAATKALFSPSQEDCIPDTEAMIPAASEPARTSSTESDLFESSVVDEGMDCEESGQVVKSDSELKYAHGLMSGHSPRLRISKLSQEDISVLSPRKKTDSLMQDSNNVFQDSISLSSHTTQDTVIHNAQKGSRYTEIPPEDSMNVSQFISDDKPITNNSSEESLHLDKEIEPMEFSSQDSDNSDATLISKPRRKSKQPAWMKDMEVESPSRKQRSPLAVAKKRRGRPRKIQDSGSPRDSSQDSCMSESDSPRVDSSQRKEGSRTNLADELKGSTFTGGDDCVVEGVEEAPRRRSLKLKKRGEKSTEEEGEEEQEKSDLTSESKNNSEEAGSKNKDLEKELKTDENSGKGKGRKSRKEKDSKERKPEEKTDAESTESKEKSGKESKKDEGGDSEPRKERRKKNKKENSENSSQSSQEGSQKRKKQKEKKENNVESNEKAKCASESEELIGSLEQSVSDKVQCVTSDSEDDIPLTMLGKTKDSIDLFGDSVRKSRQSSSQDGQKEQMSEGSQNSEKDKGSQEIQKKKNSKENKKEKEGQKEKASRDSQKEKASQESPKEKASQESPKEKASQESQKDKESQSQKEKVSKDQEKKQSEPSDSDDNIPLRTFVKSGLKRRKISVKKVKIDVDKAVGFDDSIEEDPERTRDIKTSTPRVSVIRKKSSKTPESLNKLGVKKKHSPFGKLVIEMNTSPSLRKRLRSTGEKKRGRRVLNRSLDSALAKTKRKRKRENDESYSEEDRSLTEDSKDEKVPVEFTEVKESSKVDKDVREELEKEVMENDNEIKSSMDILNVKKEILSPPKAASLSKGVVPQQSPPKKGTPFTLPETPTSAPTNKQFVRSRADVILHRSRLLLNRRHATPSPSSVKNRIFKSPSRPSEKMLKAGILKKSPENSTSPVKNAAVVSVLNKSPPPSGFRPINVLRVYSPSASPSAGILKKRRLSGDMAADSPSPPNKQRRVSFAEAAEVRTILARAKRPASPRPVNRCLDMPATLAPSPLTRPSQSKLNTPTREEIASKAEESTDSPSTFRLPPPPSSRTDTCPTQDSTQESQLNCTEPVYPALVDCAVPVEQLLPQLTSSMWMRGLGQLVRAKNIRSVGDLSRMTEYEINNLPIRAPKLTTLRNVLDSFASKRTKADPTVKAVDNSHEAQNVSTTEVTEPTDMLDQIKLVEETPEQSMEVSEKEQTVEKKDAAKDLIRPDPTVMAQKTAKEARKELLSSLSSLEAKLDPGSLSKMPSHHLVLIHQQLNGMMNNVVLALKDKCPMSPSSSQNSQE